MVGISSSSFVLGIFARGGSKGLPGKNLMSVAGKPLMELAVTSTQGLTFPSEIYCSTDSEDIAAEARKYGVRVPWLRPSHLAQDDSREWDSWVHLIRWLHTIEQFPDYLMTVPLTAPLRTSNDLQLCAEMANATKADVVFGIYESAKNPWFTMVTQDNESSKVELVIKPPKRINNRQEAPRCYDVAPTTFIIKCSFLLEAQSIYDGDTRGVLLPKENCVDIDTELDLKIADLLLSERFGITKIGP